MSSRTAVLLLSLALIAFLLYRTIRSVVNVGVTGLAVVSLGVLVLLGVGVLGALTAPPEE